MTRIIYSSLSSFMKIFIFIYVLYLSYSFNNYLSDEYAIWQRVPFVCFAIFGSKEVVELLDKKVRNLIGFSVEDSTMS